MATQTAPVRPAPVLPGVRQPDVTNDQHRLIAHSFVVPDEALDFVPGPLCHPA